MKDFGSNGKNSAGQQTIWILSLLSLKLQTSDIAESNKMMLLYCS